MDINIRDSIILSDDKEYGVVSKTTFNNLIYYYLVDINDNENIKFCVEDKNELMEVEDQNLIQNLLILFANEIKEDINEIFAEQN